MCLLGLIVRLLSNVSLTEGSTVLLVVMSRCVVDM